MRRISPIVISRRRLLQAGTAFGFGAHALSYGAVLSYAADEATTADKLIAGKDSRLLVHNPSRSGFEIETPYELLADDKITPVERLFVRNTHQPSWAATLAPADEKDWKLEIGGLTEFPRTIALAALKELPSVEHELVLQCSGNGRKLFSEASAVKGAPWLHGAMGNVRFRGVLLRDVFKKLDVRPHSSAQFITAEGFDSPALPDGADFEHSLPLRDALARTILAWELNGKPLPAVHGGPLRLVTPGYYGTMHVKWLTRLRLEAEETVNHHQVKRYRTPLDPLKPGQEFDYGLENSEPNWRMRIKSVVFAPARDAEVSAGRTLVHGVAWNDGTSRIDAVELSQDGGSSWRRAELEAPADRYAWYRWQATMTFEKGSHELICRAVDTLGRTQPLDGGIDWNPAGYGWHGAERVKFRAV